MIETGSSEKFNPPWQPDSERPPAEAPPAAKAKERTLFGLAGELRNLVREDRKQRSDHARRFNQRKILP